MIPGLSPDLLSTVRKVVEENFTGCGCDTCVYWYIATGMPDGVKRTHPRPVPPHLRRDRLAEVWALGARAEARWRRARATEAVAEAEQAEFELRRCKRQREDTWYARRVRDRTAERASKAEARAEEAERQARAAELAFRRARREAGALVRLYPEVRAISVLRSHFDRTDRRRNAAWQDDV